MWYWCLIMLCINMNHPNGPEGDLEDEESERKTKCCRLLTNNKSIMLLFLLGSEFPCCPIIENLNCFIVIIIIPLHSYQWHFVNNLLLHITPGLYWKFLWKRYSEITACKIVRQVLLSTISTLPPKWIALIHGRPLIMTHHR